MRRSNFPLLALGACVLLGVSLAEAQPPAAPPQNGPPPTGLVVGSGNYFSPIVADLDKAVAFYRDGLGLDAQGAPSDLSSNAPLMNMFGLPNAKLHQQIARTPALAGGVEIVEISAANGKPVERRAQDPGAVTLVATVRDLDATLARLERLGAPVVTRGGKPVTIANGALRIAVVKDPGGHFVEIAQPAQLPETQAPATQNVVAMAVRITVSDVDKAMSLYADALGLKVKSAPGEPSGDATVLGALGVEGGKYRVGQLQVPASGFDVRFIEFSGVDRKTVPSNVQDPGSTRMQIRVRDIDAAIAAFKRFGGEVVSTGGKALDLPAGNNTLRVAIVRDPNNLFVVLIESPPSPAG
ncbi:MAG TPA: VOC family protein [Gammaproteobacteria bacterium]|nr:VOC family protein [Gammaproteobacteria bacterium]